MFDYINEYLSEKRKCNGIIGVPITFLDKYCFEQFKIIGMESSAGYNANIVGIPLLKEGDARPAINGKTTYARILIKRKENVNDSKNI